MERAPTGRIALLALIAFTCTAVAQTRRPMLGTVVDAAGDAVAGATVHAAYSPLTSLENRDADHLTTTTDERGRFRLDAFPCTRYVVWAIGPEADGQHLVGEMVQTSTGRICELRLTTRLAPPQITVQGADEWRDLAPLSVRVAPARIVVDDRAVAVGEDGLVTLPPLPLGYSQLDVLDRDGQPLNSVRFPVREAATAKVTLYPPHKVPMRAVDEAGAPVAGVRIRQRIEAGWSSDGGYGPNRPQRRIWRELGTTDADGRLEATISARYDPFGDKRWSNLFFVAGKDGCCETHSGFTNSPYFDGKEVDGEGVDTLLFTMRPDAPFTGRVRRDAGAGLGGQRLAVHIGVKIESKEGNSWRNESYVRLVTTAEDGSFSVPGVTRLDEEFRILLDDSEAISALVPTTLQRRVPRNPVALKRMTRYPEKGADIDLSRLAAVQVQLLDETGGPASSAEVLLLNEANGDYECDAWTPTARTDSAGRMAMLVERGRWFLFARTRTGYAYQTLDLDADGAPPPLELRLQPMPAMLGKVVDGDGKPIVGATVSVHSSSWHSGGNREKGLEAIAETLNWNWIADAVSGADGVFAVRFLDLDGMTYDGKVRHGKKTTESFRIETNDEPQTFVIE